MGNRQNCAKFQEILFRSNEVIQTFCPPLCRKRPIHDHMTHVVKIDFITRREEKCNLH